jgi:outer membrane protein OmpA-like peptidoglycan-associated protein
VLNRKTILMLTMALTLNACATADQFVSDLGTALSGKTPKTETVYVNKALSGYTAAAGADQSQLNAQQFSYDTIAAQNSDDSVQLFSLDEPGQPIGQKGYGSAGTGSFGMEGVPSSADPSVTVFPFSNDMYTPGVRPSYKAPRPTAYAGAEQLPLYTGSPNIVYFDHGSAALSATARQAIASAAQHYGGMIAVKGHASHRAQTDDPTQRGLINLQMSMKRAMAVTKQLILDGVPPEAIKTTAYGDAKPAVMETDRTTEAQNRRVEILTGAR